MDFMELELELDVIRGGGDILFMDHFGEAIGLRWIEEEGEYEVGMYGEYDGPPLLPLDAEFDEDVDNLLDLSDDFEFDVVEVDWDWFNLLNRVIAEEDEDEDSGYSSMSENEDDEEDEDDDI